jgi:hypothetical protein
MGSCAYPQVPSMQTLPAFIAWQSMSVAHGMGAVAKTNENKASENRANLCVPFMKLE